MAFPINPVDQQIFTNPLGTAYKYDSTRTAWLIMSQTVVGPQGITGIQGLTGLIGDTGIQGVTGFYGITGFQGSTGVQGVGGEIGQMGDTGLIGATGIQGVTGILGIDGQTGIQGVTGILGIDGQTGIMGVDGVTGIQGVTGILGIDGQTGIQGVTGILGIDGQTGIMGVDGVTGIQGVTGILGIDGQTGIQGVTGILGIDGQTGIQGVTGFYGLTGIRGPGGVGLTNYVTKFTDGTGGIIGNSIIYDTGSRVGIGTTGPASLFHVKADTTSHAQIRLERTAFNRQSTVAFIPHSLSPANPQWNVGFLASDSSVTFSYYDGTGGGNLLTIDTSGVSVGNMPTPGYVMNDGSGRLVGGNSIPSVIRSFVQANGFVPGDVVRLDATGGWTLAQANTPENAEALGIVQRATSTDFTMVFEGYITNLASLGLTANTVYFLSADNTGKLTAYDPNIANPVLVSKPMLETDTTATGYVLSLRGIYGDPSALGTFPYRTVTADYTIGITDYSIFADSSHTPRNIQLPNASTVPGKIYNVKKIDSEVYAISVYPFGSQKIDNQNVQVISSPLSCITVQSDGSNWWII